MASIPPAWLASGIQGIGQQQRTAEARDRENAAGPVNRDSPFSHELTDAISSDDRDSQVDADGQGAGGQGRQGSDAPDETDESQQPQAGGSHIDLEA
ncbi:MAG: hypothetical protein HZB38_05215 [Planctomycetes bacterium]|nr:hypothetical protein [Planctomycetota bacterium]